MTGPIELDFITTTAHVYRTTDGGVDVLRQLYLDVLHEGEDDQEPVGQLTAWIGWGIADEDIQDCADAISADAEILGSAAADIMSKRSDLWIDAVLLIDRIFVEERYRGNRLTKTIIADVMSLFRLPEESTLVVLQPEPQGPDGGYMPDGVDRDGAMRKLCDAYRESGLESWSGSSVWWRPIPEAIGNS